MKQKKLEKFRALAGIIMAAFTLSGCALYAEFEGTWTGSPSAGTTIAMTYTKTSSTRVYSGATNGTVSFTINSYDEAADRILLTCTANPANIGGSPAGQIVYLTYGISGNVMYMMVDPTGYPPAAAAGPFTRL